MPDSAVVPSAAEVKKGTGSGGIPAIKSGQVNLQGNNEASVAVSGLSANTDYHIYVIAEDIVPNLQANPVKLEISTAAESSDTTVAPASDPTVATNIFTSTAFLYSGDGAVQTGMAPDTIQQNRAAVIRGLVLDRDGAPLTDVRITVLNHPEFGSTVSRLDGYFDMAVNGGGQLTVRYEKEGYITAQRQVDVPWQDFAILPDVIIIPYDSNKTEVDLTLDTMQVAQGSEITDADGTRQATLIIPAGVTAWLDDGTPMSNLTIRATEYTVGANGPQAMPAVLPPKVGYTYCVEYSADEAVAAGSKSVIFDPYHYVENFIGFPVVGIVPMGYYDYDQGAWIPSNNGRIIKIISINDDGLAELDIDGSSLAADAADLAGLNVTDSERQKLATLYQVGRNYGECQHPLYPLGLQLALRTAGGCQGSASPHAGNQYSK